MHTVYVPVISYISTFSFYYIKLCLCCQIISNVSAVELAGIHLNSTNGINYLLLLKQKSYFHIVRLINISTCLIFTVNDNFMKSYAET